MIFRLLFLLILLVLLSGCGSQSQTMICRVAGQTSGAMANQTWVCYRKDEKEKEYPGIQKILDEGWSPVSIAASVSMENNPFNYYVYHVAIFKK